MFTVVENDLEQEIVFLRYRITRIIGVFIPIEDFFDIRLGAVTLFVLFTQARRNVCKIFFFIQVERDVPLVIVRFAKKPLENFFGIVGIADSAFRR